MARHGERIVWAEASDCLDYEPRLVAVVGPDASRLHSGRSRQDIASTIARMNLRAGLMQEIDALILARDKALTLAAHHIDTIIPAYTHGVQAQPTTFAHYVLALISALTRTTQRLREAYARVNRNPLGTESDPTDADADDDGVSDGYEWQRRDKSDPLDPDTDDNELLDGLELFNPVTLVSDNDSDDDSILDGEDVDYIVHTVESLPDPAFRAVAQRTLVVNEVRTLEQSIASSNRALALTQLGSLRQRMNGCGSAPDSTDWIIDRAGQKDVRTYIDLLITNLSN